MDTQRVEQIADLHTIGAGAAAEQFATELKAVLANIRDPNTEPEAKRKIVLEFVFVPDKSREVIATLISARSSMASTKPTSEVMFVGTKDGEPVGTVMHGSEEKDPRQGVFPLSRKVEGGDR